MNLDARRLADLIVDGDSEAMALYPFSLSRRARGPPSKLVRQGFVTV